MKSRIPFGRRITKSLFFALSLLVMMAGSLTAYADSSVQLSKNSDFSSSDRSFSIEDTLYIKVSTDRLDPTEIEENEFELEPNGNGESIEGSLKNNLDGTFTGKVALSQLKGQTSSWSLAIEIEGDNDQTFTSNTALTISGLTREKDYSTLTGQVTLVAGGSITIAGKTIRITDSTSVVAADGTSITLADIQSGDRLIVTVFDDNDELVAASIRLVGTGFARMNIEGKISQVYSDSIRICDFTLSVDQSAEIRGEGYAELSIGDLDSTMSVEAQAATGANGWVLQQLNVEEREDADAEEDEEEQDEEVSCEYELKGYVGIANADSGYVEIGGLGLWTTEETEFEGEFSGLGGLMANAHVEIEFEKNSEGEWVITELERRGKEEQDFEFSGTIESVGEGFITVNNTRISITEQTIIVRDDEPIANTELYSGLKVEVEVIQTAGGSFEAHVIKIEDELDEEVELKGNITAVNPDSTIQIQQTWIKVNSSTEISGEADQSLSFGDLSEGLWAEVEAEQSLDSVLTATKIEVEDRFEENRIEVEGTIETVSSTSVTLKSGRTFTVDSFTEIEGKDDQILTIDSLAAGDYVEIEGKIESDGTFLAYEIKLEEHEKAYAKGELSGTVDAVTADSITVNGMVFHISADNTMFIRFNSVGELQAGSYVEVRYRLLSEGNRVARSIKLADQEEDFVELEGSIDSVSTSLIVVADVEVQITDSTEVVADSSMTISDLAAGMTVEVKGHHEAGGQIVADIIKVEEMDVVASTIESTGSSGTSVTLAGKTVTVDKETFIYNQNKQVLQASELEAGMFVEVVSVTSASSSKAKQTTSSGSYAQEIEVMSSSSTTSVGDRGKVLPSAYKLNNNYPNPFNPTTNISYELQQRAHVTLTVYNVLGRKVAELVNEQLQAGSYIATWDASRMASGTYFVRMKVQISGKVVSRQTQKMMLLK